MRFLILIFLFCLQSLSVGAQGLDATGVAPRYLRAVGKSFEVMGPNCFGTALKLSGFQSTFRGVDVGEFQAFLNLACRPVESPEPGDIGVFEAPGFALLHAYIYLSPDLGIEKPGVDYLGKTPIALNSLESILYRSIASPECRRYAKDVSECSNRHFYVRCAGIPESRNSWAREHQRKVLALEALMGPLLEVAVFGPEQVSIVMEMSERLDSLRRDLSDRPVGEVSEKRRVYLQARLSSLKKQLQYFQMKSGVFE